MTYTTDILGSEHAPQTPVPCQPGRLKVRKSSDYAYGAIAWVTVTFVPLALQEIPQSALAPATVVGWS